MKQSFGQVVFGARVLVGRDSHTDQFNVRHISGQSTSCASLVVISNMFEAHFKGRLR